MPIWISRDILRSAIHDTFTIFGETPFRIFISIVVWSVPFLILLVRTVRTLRREGWSSWMQSETPWSLVTKHWKALAYVGLIAVAFGTNLLKATYTAGLDAGRVQSPASTPSPPEPKLDISWNGKALDRQTITLDDPAGGFTLRFDFRSNLEIPHPSVLLLFSRPINIGGSDWKETGNVELGFTYAVSWNADRPMYANQPWSSPELSGSLFEPNKRPLPVNVRLEVYYSGRTSPRVVNFVLRSKPQK